VRPPNKLNKNSLFLWGLIILAYVFSFLLRLPAFNFPLDWDAGGHYFYGRQTATRGFFSVFWDMRTVGIVLVFALIYKLFSGLIIGVYIVGSLVWICSTIFIYKLTKLLFDFRIGVLAALIFALFSSSRVIQGEMVNSEVFMILPTLIGIYFFFKAREGKNWRFFALAGLSFGVAFTIKQVVIFDMLALLTYSLIFLYRDFKKEINLFIKSNLILAFSFLVPIFLFGLYFFLTNKFGDFFYWQFTKAFRNNSSYHLLGNGINNFVSSFSQIFKKSYPVWLIFFGGVITTIFYFRATKRIFLFFWIFWVFLGMYFMWWFSPHHFLQLTPPISIFSGLFITDSLVFLTRSRKWLQKYLLAMSLSIVFLFLVFFVKSDLVYFTSFYNEVTGKISWKTHLSLVGWDVGPAGLTSVYEAGKYLNEVTQKDEKIFSWAPATLEYIFADRGPLTRFVYKYPLLSQELTFMSYKGWFNNYLNDRIALMGDLNRNFPKYLIIEVNPELIFDEMFSFQDFSRFVSANYLLDKQFGNCLIFVKKDQPKSLIGSSAVIPLEIIERYAQIISIKESGDINKIIFEPMVNTNGILRRLTADTPLDKIQITDLLFQGAEVKEDLVGFVTDTPSGTPDLHIRVKGLSQPLSFARVKIGDFAWNSQSYGVNPIIKVIQNGDLFDLYLEPVKIEEQKTVEIYFVHQNGELAKTSINIVPQN